jgi:hypothetical protein
VAVTLQEILEDLNYLLGDTSVPSTGIDNQKRFINRSIETIWDRTDWSWAGCSTIYNFSGTTQILPSNFDSIISVREVVTGSDNDNVYTIGDVEDKDTGASDYLLYVEGNRVDGYTMTINQTNNPSLTVRYKKTPDVLSATSDTTRIPRSMPIARGAYLLMNRAQPDPEVNLTEVSAEFEKDIAELMRLDNRGKPKQRFYTLSQSHSQPIGKPR